MAVTVGIDIGTTSVKAIAVDDDGRVLRRARVVHEVRMPAPGVFEHDPDVAWRAGVLAAFEEVRQGLDVVAVNVAAMVPSLCAVDADGRALTPGLLYGDARGGAPTGANPSESGELLGFLRWCAAEAPDAVAFWPAQAVANHALCEVGAIDSVTAMTTLPLFDFTGWDPAVCAEAGVRPEQLPAIVTGTTPAVTTADGVVVGGGTIDAFGEQLVAGADHAGDVFVVLGTTLVLWAVVPDWVEVPGLWTVPHTAPGLTLVGGASNAGGLFVNWARQLAGDPDDDAVAAAGEPLPWWEPYVRGERTPLHDPHRRAVLHDLAVGMGPGHVVRAAYEASGHVLRHHLDLAGLLDGSGATGQRAQRLVLTGGGTRVPMWTQALADVTGLPADVVAVPEGGALGAAYLARAAAGLEPDASGASRWAATDHRVEPDAAASDAVAARYASFASRAGTVDPS